MKAFPCFLFIVKHLELFMKTNKIFKEKIITVQIRIVQFTTSLWSWKNSVFALADFKLKLLYKYKILSSSDLREEDLKSEFLWGSGNFNNRLILSLELKYEFEFFIDSAISIFFLGSVYKLLDASMRWLFQVRHSGMLVKKNSFHLFCLFLKSRKGSERKTIVKWYVGVFIYLPSVEVNKIEKDFNQT